MNTQHTPSVSGSRARRGTSVPGRLGRALAAALWLGVLASPAAAQTGAPPAEHGAEAPAAGHEGAEHGESVWAFLSRLANFAILAGGLYYLLRSPVGKYLEARAQQIGSDLVNAADTRMQASARLGEIEARLKALPGEIDALKARGHEEIAAEEARIRQAADTERARLMEQTRREIDRQLQLARRELTEHAADLAVGVARARLSREITDADQQRFIDRYASQVGAGHE